MFDEYNEVAKPMREDERIDLMRRFVDLTQTIDKERQVALEREAKTDALLKERESVREALLRVINPNQPASAVDYAASIR